MTLRNVVALCIALVSAGSAIARDQILKPEQTRPWVNQRYILGLVTNEDGLDVFWIQRNELVDPLRARVLRTRLTAEGLLRGPAALIWDHERSYWNAVHGDGPFAQALWTDQRDTLLVSPVLERGLQFPEGKFVASFADDPRLVCAGSRCVASWETAGERTGVILDSQSNTISAPFFFPYGGGPMSMTVDEGGIFFVHHRFGELRAARIGYDEGIRYDVSVAATDPATPISVAFDGSRHLVAYIERSVEPPQVHAVVISDAGAVSSPVTLMHANDPRTDLVSIALAWNGTSFLLAGGYNNGFGIGFVRRFDAELGPLDPLPVNAGVAFRSPQIQVIGTNFAIGWDSAFSGLEPLITIVSSEGEISQPIGLEAVSRRRGALRP